MMDSITSAARRQRLLFLLAITALGAFLRLYSIGDLPPGDGYDAAQYGLDALEILDGARPVFLAANFGREVLFSYLVALVFLFSGPGTLGIHLSSALIGIATIPAVYLAARQLLVEESELINVWAPLLAALVTAVSYWHLNYSRAGLRVIWVPLFASLLTAALWYGIRRGSRPALAGAGILMGLSQYTYQAARLLPLLALAGFVLAFIERRSFNRRDLAHMAITFGLSLLVFAPLGIFALEQPEIFNDRLRQTALFSQEGDLAQQAAAIGDQVSMTLRMFFIEGDNEPLFTIPGRPSLNPFLALAFLAGLAVSLWRWKRSDSQYLLVWLLLLVAPAMIADQAATGKRALGALPAVAILIAIGLTEPYAILRQQKSRWQSKLFASLVALGLVWTAVTTINDYFVRWGQDPALAAHYQRDHTEIGLAVGRLSRQETILISPFPASHPAIRLHSDRHPGLRSYDGHRCLVIPDPDDGGITYLIVPGETESSLEQLAQIFPGGATSAGPSRPDSDEVYFTAYQVPAGSEAQLADGDELLLNWNNEIGLLNYDLSPERVEPGDDLELTLTYKALADLDTNYTAYVHLLGGPNLESSNQIWGQSDGEPCGGAVRTGTWRAGDILRDTIHLRLNADAPPGTYQVTTGFYTWPDITPLALVDQELGVVTTLKVR